MLVHEMARRPRRLPCGPARDRGAQPRRRPSPSTGSTRATSSPTSARSTSRRRWPAAAAPPTRTAGARAQRRVRARRVPRPGLRGRGRRARLPRVPAGLEVGPRPRRPGRRGRGELHAARDPGLADPHGARWAPSTACRWASPSSARRAPSRCCLPSATRSRGAWGWPAARPATGLARADARVMPSDRPPLPTANRPRHP